MRVGCIEAEGLPLSIPAGSHREVPIRVTTRVAGGFAGDITLYTDCDGQLKVPLKVEGLVVKGPGAK